MEVCLCFKLKVHARPHKRYVAPRNCLKCIERHVINHIQVLIGRHRTSKSGHQTLRRSGVLYGSHASGRQVVLSNEERIDYGVCVWSTGNASRPLVQARSPRVSARTFNYLRSMHSFRIAYRCMCQSLCQGVRIQHSARHVLNVACGP